MRADRQTDVTKLIGAFGDYANGSKMAVKKDEYFPVSVHLIFKVFV